MLRIYRPLCLLALFTILCSSAWGSDDARAVGEWAERTARAWARATGKDMSAAAAAKSTILVPMRDGAQLSADLYQPFFPGAYPVILMRTPYGKEDPAVTQLATIITFSGYVCVIQDTRGRGGSEGEARAFFDDGWGLNTLADPAAEEHWDGYDSVEWIAGQPWCDGKVGMFGFSALGIAANMAAGSYPPHLKCAVVYVAAQDIYHDAAHQGGGFRKSLVEGWLAGVSAKSDVLAYTIAGEAYDANWRHASLESRYSTVTIPIYHSGGWYDIFQQGTLDAFAGLQAAGGPGAAGNQKVIIGPWTHGGQDTTVQGELTYPENSVVQNDEVSKAIGWFAHWLKGEENGIDALPPVRYYMMGAAGDASAPGNEWRQAGAWPVAAQSSALHLASGERLLGVAPAASGEISFVSDPENPPPTVGGANLNLPAGPYDQRSVEARGDVLVFSTEPLSEPLEVTGRLELRLFASSSALDTDWAVRLCDVYPDGRSMLVVDGLRRAKFRDGFSTATLLTPGETYEFSIDLWSTAIVFQRGHRIRLSVSGGNSPRFDPNPNTGDPLRQNTTTVDAVNSVRYGANYPSRLLLPVTAPEAHPVFSTFDEAPKPSELILY